MFTLFYMFAMGANLFYGFQGHTLNLVVFIIMAFVFIMTGGFSAVRR